MTISSGMRCLSALMAFLATSGAAWGSLSADDVKAVGRALAFLETAPADGAYSIAVIYGSDDPHGEAWASAAAKDLAALAGPKRTRIKAAAYTLEDVLHSEATLDALVIGTDLKTDARLVSDFIRKRKLLSIGSSPACLKDGSCVLMVNAGRKIEIVLDTKLADELGVRFSSVFTIMVTRR